jgi:hypothetical protein
MRLQGIALVGIALHAAPASAGFHLWDIVEVFSNGDGSVQFVELATAGSNEHFVANHDLVVFDGATSIAAFTIPDDLATQTPTTNRRFLVATPGFASLPGAVTPDFTFDAEGFIDLTLADTIAWPSGLNSLPLAGLPTDGVLSLGVGGATAVNSPTNFAGATGSIDVPEPGATLLGVGALVALASHARRAR